MRLERYPVDFEALKKDSWIETVVLTAAFGLSPADGARWNFALVGLVQQIARESEIVARIDHDRIRLMTDTEADEYTYRRVEQHVYGIHRAVCRRALIDRAAMGPEMRLLAERRDRAALGIDLAARGEMRRQRKIEALVHRPKLLSE